MAARVDALPAHHELALSKVNVAPLQAKQLPASQAGEHCDLEQRAEPLGRRRLQEEPDLSRLPHVLAVRPLRRERDVGCRVHLDELEPVGSAERAREHRVDASDRDGATACGQLVLQKAIDVMVAQLGQPERSQRRHDVALDVSAVHHRGRGAQALADPTVKPIGHPLADGEPAVVPETAGGDLVDQPRALRLRSPLRRIAHSADLYTLPAAGVLPT
nr:hypothetical protein [Amnibacterium sp.]